ncbi:serine/threonine-protein kinase [Leptolyngbya ohadii]|uniref:serine/threonine-protein kinase n=1 Tax=Leptolyngbya ohadii TaxID=1962290 RepID=UPI000B599691|nr:serine/threonine-protein kinase [Leptolyngbya ohadii]
MANPPESDSKNALNRSKYRLLGLVGQGQFGRVFCAAHRQTGQLVALKNLDRDRFPTAQFLRELRFLLSLKHPNIVMFKAVEHTATGRYLVMDYCEGGTLRSLMVEEGGLNLPQSLKLVIDILSGLGHAHDHQIVHCDIKPENILLNVTPTGWTARISDFGIARLTQELADHRLSNTGSPAYMAPERFYGQYSPTSDLYSVGILLYELLAGHRPFSGTPGELMTAHLNLPVTFPGTVPAIWQPILNTALQKLSARRYRSAQEMRDAILATALAANLLDSDVNLSPLLKSVTLHCSTAFHAQYQETLRSPIHELCSAEYQSQRFVFRSSHEQVTFQDWSQQKPAQTDYTPQPEVWHLAPLPASVTQLIFRPQGCFVVLEKSLHLIAPEKRPSEGQTFVLTPQLVWELPLSSMVAIEAKGRWLAVLMQDMEEGLQLRFDRIPQSAVRMTITPHPLPLTLPTDTLDGVRLLALDAHHVAVLTDIGHPPRHPIVLTQSKKLPDCKTEVQIFCRRGQRIGAVFLPLHLKQILLTSRPYRLLAVDRHNPDVLALIDLKPYRILRIGVDITPTFLAEAPWGYLLADRAGKIILLDTEGQKVGCLNAPEPITAIAALGQHQIVIATWNDTQGNLYTVNLKEVDVDLIF